MRNKRLHDQIEPESEQADKKQKYDIIAVIKYCQSCHKDLTRPLTLPCGYTCCTACHNSNATCLGCNRIHTTTINPNVVLQSMQNTLSTTDKVIPILSKLLSQALECAICCTRFTTPATTPCGHTFYDDDDESQDVFDVNLERDDRIPLLIGSLAFPDVDCALHIFEPRYRLMLRRVMQSNRHRFGLCLVRRKRSEGESPFYEYGTTLELKHVQTLPDGRSIVEAVGSHRFRVTKYELMDGYHTAEIERVDDLDREQQQMLEQQQILKSSASRAKFQQQQQKLPPHHPLIKSPIMADARQSWAQQAHPQITRINRAPWIQMHTRGLSVACPKPYKQDSLITRSTVTAITKQTNKANKQESTTDELMDELISFIQKLVHCKQSNPETQWLNALCNPPSLDRGSRDRIKIVWWVANMMPLSEEEKIPLLTLRTLRERVLLIMSWVSRFDQQWSFFLNTSKVRIPSSSVTTPCSIS
ncbi:hypothetical protein RO3G_02652 [Rhizopus delemar RA 99-880]|uniref:Lon N-terminal domain-containing protein n=1 Tax=Rhizopus delemar (strain RA 99-880 / ATCC MYA-4621 / FGSC 9543 / NRRL 43880) TaxID=246409 RepID=I1BP18_RHIO9|nr:hypothetical protein RO3G_02652 [Rhizopus delemar RA 99-880]|eukprot:EIE77948.1 hypothetical protein RO3G_02652 [Rhizopus delemar RA 99-880]